MTTTTRAQTAAAADTRGRAATTGTGVATSWPDRVESVDWDTVRGDLDIYGCALTGRLLTADDATDIAGLYTDGYFAETFPDAVVALKQALYPRLLPIAHDWWTRLGRDTPWPDTLDEWLDMCHTAGQTKSTRFCSNTARATGTRCTATCTASSCSRCRS